MDGTPSSPRDVVGELVDRRLGCRYDAHEVAGVVLLTAACVGDNPSHRQSMADTVPALEQLQQQHGRSLLGTGGKL